MQLFNDGFNQGSNRGIEAARFEPPQSRNVRGNSESQFEPPQSRNVRSNPESRLDFDVFRRLRTELQQLQEIMQTVSKGYVRLDACNAYVQKTISDVKVLIKEIEDNEGLSRDYADNIRYIVNIWEQMRDSHLLTCPPGKVLDAQELTHALTVFDAQMKGIIFEIGYLTIPDRLNAWLRSTTPGHYVPFHDVFENEMPDYGDRVKLLNLIAWAPTITRSEGGIVEPDTGLVYCYERNGVKRFWWNVFLVFVFVLVTALIASLAYIKVEGWPLSPKNLFTLLVGWASVNIGVLVHVGVDAAKQQQKTTRHSVISFGDLPLLINAKFGQIVLKILFSLIGFGALVFALGIQNAKPIDYFLTGYSLDSFIGILTASFEQKSAAQLTTLKKQLGVADS